MKTLIEIWEEIWNEIIPTGEEHKRALGYWTTYSKKLINTKTENLLPT